MPERDLIFDVGPIQPCGCRWQLWAEGDAWHIGAACEKCQDEILALVHEFFQNLPTVEVP